MSDRRHRHNGRSDRRWPPDTVMARAFLIALGRWLAAHHDDLDATIMLPTGTVTAEQLGQVLRALERARQAEASS